MSTLAGWETEGIHDRNGITENRRFKEDEEKQRQRLKGPAWDGKPDPCVCDDHDFAHFHEGSGYKEGEPCAPKKAKSFWEKRLSVLGHDKAEQGKTWIDQLEAARLEAEQAEEAKQRSLARCATLQRYTEEAFEALQAVANEMRKSDATDGNRQKTQWLRAEEDCMDCLLYNSPSPRDH